MSRRKNFIELEEIPTLKQAYEERKFSPRNLKRAATLTLNHKYEHNEEFNKKLSLIQADITKLKIDAIVNAANETLLGGGGVDGAIHRAAGPELRHECWDLNGCDTGDAKITKGYDLPSKHVIHTVGPIGEKPSLLRSAYERSMEVMCENNLKSIAFSNISTGVYGYPRPKAGHIALGTIRIWLEKNSDYFDKLDRIIFCVFEDENKDVYETLFPLYFPPPDGIDNYVKEEEKSRPKPNEEKKDNEAEKDKVQMKTHTSLTIEQINNNKEIIGTDNDNGIKGKDEKNHETLTTEKVSDKGLSTDKDKEGKEKVEDKDKTHDAEASAVSTERNKQDNGTSVGTELTTESTNQKQETGMSVEQKEQGIDASAESTDQKQESGMSVEQKEQGIDASAESTDQKQETGMSVEQKEQGIDASAESTKQDKQNIEMPNVSTENIIQGVANEQDGDKTHDSEILDADQKHNEQNSKKRSHDSVTPDGEAEQDDANGSQNNITNVTVMKGTDVTMEEANGEPPTDVSEMDLDVDEKEPSQETSQTDGNIQKNDGSETKVIENNSKI